MKQRFNSIMILAAIIGSILVVCAQSAQAQDKTVYLVCTWDTSSIWTVNGKEKFERRLYVSPIVSMTTEAYLAQDSTGDRLEGLCGNYLDETVVKAATARGEKLDPGGQLTVIRNIELSGEDAGGPNPYKYATRESVDQKRTESINDGKDAGRVIFNFNWDPTRADTAKDFANETNRRSPDLSAPKPAAPPVKPKTRT
jgi:hypothetical protein